MQLRRSTRERRSAVLNNYMVFLQEHEVNIRVMEDDPINFRQTVQSSSYQKWTNAMNKEIKSMKNNDVWDLIPLPEDVKLSGYKWVFKYQEGFKR